MTSSMAERIKNRLLEHCTLMGFDYKGVRCDVDPFSDDNYNVFCDGVQTKVRSIDDVMKGKYFLGHSLEEIADEIEIDEW